MFFSDEYNPDNVTGDRLHYVNLVLKQTIASTHDGVLIVDPDGDVICYNQRFANMWEIPDEILSTHSDKKLIEHVVEKLQSPDEFVQLVEEVYEDQTVRRSDLLKFKDGQRFRRFTRPIWAGDEYLGRVWTFRDISARHRATRRVEYLAYHDRLTGLPNRTAFEERCEQEFDSEQSGKTVKALYLLDLNRFNRVNVTLGDEAGDQLLQAVVERWEDCLEPDWHFSRNGGDEFSLIVPEVDGRDHARSIAETFLEALGEPFEIEGNKLHVRASIGVALYPKHGQRSEELINHVRLAMKQARRNYERSNSVEFFLPDMGNRDVNTILLETRIKRAIEEDGFHLAYQPQVEINSGRVIGFEALLRWNLDGHGSISPETIIPVAEETGLIIDLGSWVLDQACQQLEEWNRQHDEQLRMGVNLSARQLVEGEALLQDVETMLNRYGLKPECLEFEVTETLAIQDVDFANEILNQLRDFGVRLNLDDFGTGQASLSYLNNLKFDAIKIDRSFIKELDQQQRHRELLSTIFTLADKLEMDVISEGVENEHQLEILKQLECPVVQGFHLGYPEPMPEADQLFKDGLTVLESG